MKKIKKSNFFMKVLTETYNTHYVNLIKNFFKVYGDNLLKSLMPSSAPKMNCDLYVTLFIKQKNVNNKYFHDNIINHMALQLNEMLEKIFMIDLIDRNDNNRCYRIVNMDIIDKDTKYYKDVLDSIDDESIKCTDLAVELNYYTFYNNHRQ